MDGGYHSGGSLRRFLFLQGPHGPFFARLAAALEAEGHDCLHMGASGGDRLFRPGRAYAAFRGLPEDWPGALRARVAHEGISDLVVYGEGRAFHAEALAVARAAGLRTHIFEEGYIRPYWITYEREGSNGASPVAGIGLDRMAEALGGLPEAPGALPARWGDTRAHVAWSLVSHGASLAARRPGLPPHRDVSLAREAALAARKLALLPVQAAVREARTRRLAASGSSYDVVLLQLAHDASFRSFSDAGGLREVVGTVMAGFAAGAPGSHLLVFKAHPFEDGREPLARTIRESARAHGVAQRVVFLPGGQLARLLDGARAAVTVNSTSAHQALWRGLPVKALGRSVYARPGIVSGQTLPEFFADPDPPDMAGYLTLRRFLLASSQIPGGFYSARGRRLAVPEAARRMLSQAGPYEAAGIEDAARPQHLRAFG